MALQERESVVPRRVGTTASGAFPKIVQLPARRAAPTVWLLVADKVGDNRQVELIADRLTERFGWQVDVRRLAFGDRYRTGKPDFCASRAHVDDAKSDPIEPPWPDAVLTIGRRPSMVALWIKARSHGHTRLVIVGRPRRWLEHFDLIVAAAHHLVPLRENVARLSLPLIAPDRTALERARAQWTPKLAGMPRPIHALFVGGPTKPHVFDAAVADALRTCALDYVRRDGGSLWIATSPRTSSEVADALGRALPPSARLYRWSAGCDDNPYLGLLACADRFIVTGDSISMLTEVARSGRPLAIYPLPNDSGLVDRTRRAIARTAYHDAAPEWWMRAVAQLQALGLLTLPREVTQIHQRLLADRRAVCAGEPFLPAGTGVDVDIDRIADRVAALARESATGEPARTYVRESSAKELKIIR